MKRTNDNRIILRVRDRRLFSISLFRHCRCDNHVEMIILPRMSFCLLIKSITWHNISVIIIIVDSASSRYTAERGRLKNNVQTFQSVKFIHQTSCSLNWLHQLINVRYREKWKIDDILENWKWRRKDYKLTRMSETAHIQQNIGTDMGVKSCCSKEKLMTCHDDEGWKSSRVGGKIS